MPLRSTPPTPTQQALLDRFHQAGVVLEAAFFAHSDQDDPKEMARLAVLGALAQQEDEAFRRQHTGKRKEPSGTPLSVLDWLTSSYDVAEGTLRLFHYGKDFRSKSPTVDHGLPRALFDPPYSVRFPELKGGWPRSIEAQAEHEAALGELLREFLSVIAGIEDPDDVDGLLLTEWTTDWHGYFDDGHEWWGAFCWTVHRPDQGSIAVLIASTTD